MSKKYILSYSKLINRHSVCLVSLSNNGEKYMFYCIQDNLTKCNTLPDKDYIAIIPAEKAPESNIVQKYLSEIPVLLVNFHFSKVQFFPDFIYGSINIPEILISEDIGLSFICDSNGIIFIDRNNFASLCFDKIFELHRDKISSTGEMLYYMLDYMVSEDLEKMNAIQQNLVQLEQDILNNSSSEPIREITNFRNGTMKLYHYYIQLAGICGDLCNNSLSLFNEDAIRLFKILSEKISLLSHEAQQIWEYTSQIRDIYQQQLDVHQNSIMKFLTIVTTIFMPLTLITGWYGMNFTYMPELHFRYSYPIVFALCLIIATILCIIFKKKKWW